MYSNYYKKLEKDQINLLYSQIYDILKENGYRVDKGAYNNYIFINLLVTEKCPQDSKKNTRALKCTGLHLEIGPFVSQSSVNKFGQIISQIKISQYMLSGCNHITIKREILKCINYLKSKLSIHYQITSDITVKGTNETEYVNAFFMVRGSAHIPSLLNLCELELRIQTQNDNFALSKVFILIPQELREQLFKIQWKNDDYFNPVESDEEYDENYEEAGSCSSSSSSSTTTEW